MAALQLHNTKYLRLSVPEPDEALERLPGSRLYAGDILVPWTDTMSRRLTALRLPALSRIAYDYDWPSYKPVVPAPMQHQVRVADFFVRNPRCYCFADIGTGKTLSVLWAFDYLKRLTPTLRMLVVCPLTIVNETWGDTLNTHFKHLSYSILTGAAAKRAQAARGNTDIHVINFDGVEVIQNTLAQQRYDIVVVDESTAYKNASTKRWKALSALLPDNVGLWLLSGTPTPQGPMDAYGQAKIMRCRTLPKTTMAFKMQTMVQVTSFKWVPRKGSEETIKQYLSPAIYVDKREVMPDLPPVTTLFRRVEMTTHQKRVFDEMRVQMQASDQGTKITAANAAVKLCKLLQIAAGVVYDDNGDVISFDNKPRVTEMLNFLEQSRSKSIVYVPFVHVLNTVSAALDKAGVRHAVIFGGVPRTERERIFKSFQTSDEYEVLLAIPNAMAHGVTATAASTVVWFMPQSRNEVYTQASGRVDRKGQKLPVTLGHIYGHAVEKQLYEAQQTAVDYERRILSMYKTVLTGAQK